MGSRQHFLLDLHSVLNIDCSVKAEKWHPLCVDWFPINLAFSAVSPAGPPPAFFQQKYRNDIQQRNQNRKGHCFIQSLSRGNPGAVEATGRVIEIKVRQEWTDSGDSQSEMYFTIPVGPEMVQNSILSTGSVKPLSTYQLRTTFRESDQRLSTFTRSHMQHSTGDCLCLTCSNTMYG